MRLASTVGGAPTARLARYYSRSAAACGHFDHWEDAQWQRKADAERELRKGWAIIKRVDRDLSPLRPGMRPLPRRDGPSSASRIAIRYSRVAAQVGEDARVRVRCWSLKQWTGVLRSYRAYGARSMPEFVIGFLMRPHDINLSPEVCKALDEFTYGHLRPSDTAGLDELAEGVNTLAHESMHIHYPLAREAVVECHGMQSIASTAELLGSDESYGQKLARAYYRDIYSHQLPSYRSPECRKGGRLDVIHWDAWP
jgi:hypothetical protein